MSGIVDAMKKVAEAEVRKVHVTELGVVTSVFPHSSDGDKDNYECNVKLKDLDVELRKVPATTPNIGLASIPHVGDLVLLTFINGDINSPVIIGRLYNDEDRPPTSNEEEIVYVPPYSKSSSLRRLYISLPEGTVTLTFQDDQVKMHVGDSDITVDSNGVTVQTQKDVALKVTGDFTVQANNIKFESQSDTQFTADGNMTIKGTQVNINP